MNATETYLAYKVMQFGKPIEAVTETMGAPEGTEVVLATIRCGVCHTDLHLFDGYYDLGQGRRMELQERNITPPLALGHEIVAQLLAAGPDANLDGLEIGKNYLVSPWIGCGQCGNCRQGKENLCLNSASLGVYQDGGYAHRLKLPDPKYLVDIEGLDITEAATLACSGLTAYSALKKSDAAKDDWLAMFGMGGLGTSALLIAKALGYQKIVAVDIDDRKLAAAQQLGASKTVNINAPEASAILQGLEGGLLTVIDFVGSSVTSGLGTQVLSKGGKYIIIGLFGGDLNIALPLVPIRAISIIGSYVGNLIELRELIALAKQGALGKIPVELIAPEQINLALERLRSGTATARQVIAFQ
ncbi:NAD-dependent alcohol dehydrogenase [Advenella faeciporci]|uniref:NAD-dependent alcohol dehydrogenase n=1 Tax=Advenella faeciporci TaxID=797535 RepID=A0A918JQB8_9BURK|nr:alcohol dehydrogenase [Advenella faeciporci]GGW97147.1 NAD-dependent alcohol dehydrogenase [Advenella faeciporci]